MEKIFSNGKKVVKFFLRLLPIFILIGCFIIALSDNHQVYAVTDYDSNTFVKSYQSNLSVISSNIWNNVHSLFINDMLYNDIVYDVSDRIAYLWSNGNLGIEDLPIVSQFIILLLLYELVISFLFLIFDVFNYMFTICEKFFNKGNV